MAASFLIVMLTYLVPRTGEVVAVWPSLPVLSADILKELGERVIERGDAGHPNRRIENVTRPSISVFLPDRAPAPTPAVILCPGGGYGGLAIDKEGFAMAERLNKAGIAALILKYRMPEGDPSKPVDDIRRAIQITRSSATRWNIDPKRVGVMGFSAGGHLAGMSATIFDRGNENPVDPISRESSRPDFVALAYPVISMRDDICHKGSRKSLLGDAPTEEQIERFSVELQIAGKTPTMFVVHAKDDKSVPIANSERLVEAAKQAGVPCEFIIVTTGGHGFGLGAEGSEAATWFESFLKWMPHAYNASNSSR